MKKIICLIFAGFLLGCSSTPYEDLALKGYGVSKADGRFLSKSGEKTSYYKYNDEKAGLYLIIEKNEATGEVTALLNLEYTGRDWLYIERVLFKGQERELEVDFISHKFSGALTQETPGVSGSVRERILVPITDDQVGKLGEVLMDSPETEVVYSSRYREGRSSTSISPEEREGLETMIKLYNKVKGEKVNGN